MKRIILSILAGTSIIVSGCNMTPVQQSAVETVLQIGLRVAVAKIADANPGIAPYLQIVGSSLQQPIQSIEPDALHQHIKDVINQNVTDKTYKDSLFNLSNMIIDFYSQVWEKNKGQISELVYIEIISAFGQSILSGTANSVASGSFTTQINDTLVIIQ